ncbi:MAG: redoxin family protein [Isosphaeraceae bacterium]
MRSLLYSVTTLVLVGLTPLAARAQSKPRDLLKLLPTFSGVDCDTPTDAAAIDACKVENVLNAKGHNIGYALRDGQGKLLRKFVDTDGNNRLDQWSYYQDGFEVYREVDLDGDRRLDECRWLNHGGSRAGTVTGRKIAAWKQISAEEASKVFVQALTSGDLELLQTVMATPEELTAAGVPKDVVARVATAATKRDELVAALRKSLVGWNRQTTWNRFDGTFPHVIPADSNAGLEQDVTLYENAMIFPGAGAAEKDPAKMAFLQIPDMIRLGATWKFVELPYAIDPEKPVVAAAGGLRTMLFDKANNVQPRDEAMETALKALADFDVKNADLARGGEPEKIVKYHLSRITHLRAIVKAAPTVDEKLNYNRQVVDSLIGALRTGLYPQGKEPMARIIADGGKLGSYAAYRSVEVDFAIANEKPGANLLANQKKWMTDLEAFLDKFADSDEAPDVLLQLASANEYNGEEKTAREQYSKVVEKYPASEASKKAGGAVRRLDLVGKSLALKGPGLKNETIDSAQFAGKTQLYVFWATWAGPFKVEMPELVKVYQKYHDKGLEIVGINLDNERGEVDAFLAAHQAPWAQIFEGGGMESRLAIEYGIISVPTMFLVDADGKVVSRSLRNSADLDRQLEKLLAAKQPGVALDQRN